MGIRPINYNFRKGLTKTQIGDSYYDIPTAFLNRIRFDLDASNQTAAVPRGREADFLFRRPMGSKYVAYRMPQNLLDQWKRKYSGSGSYFSGRGAYGQRERLINQYRTQQQQLKDYAKLTGSVNAPKRIIKQTATGQIKSDTGKPITRQQTQALNPAISRQQRKEYGNFMNDLNKFKSLRKTRVISNVPVRIK